METPGLDNQSFLIVSNEIGKLVARTEEGRTMTPRLTVLAAGAVETSRTVAELAGSLATMAAVEANAIAAHSCTGRVWMSMLVEKDRECGSGGRGEVNVSNCGRDTWTLSANVNM